MRSFLSPLAALALVACVQDVGTGKVEATVSEVPDVQAAAPVAVTTLRVDPSKSTLTALGAKVTEKHLIAFHDYSGEVGLGADGSVVSVGFVARVDSLTTDNARLAAHLLREDFLFAEKYPTAEFVSTEVKAGSDVAGATHTVTGDLTIRGKTKRVSFPATIGTGASGVTAKTEFVIDRQDFEVTYPGKPDNLVQDNVVLTIEFVASPATS